MQCTRCGQFTAPDSRFCFRCGMPLITVEVDIQLPQAVDTPFMEAPQYPPAPAPVPVKKGTLRVPAIILAVLCVIGFVVFALFPGEQSPSKTTQLHREGPFSIMDGYLYFYESDYTGSEELIVPETVSGIKVTNIGECCFDNCDSLSSVKLPQTVRYVESWAFYDCDSLRGIEIPEGVLYIGEEAFADCDKLEALVIPASIETLDASAFDDCESLKYVFFTGTTEQWKQLFHGCEGSIAMVYCTDGKVPLRKLG